jgi:penicillin V acylase-like amidase (Ntn superfamily)
MMKYNKFIQTVSLVTAVTVNMGWVLDSHACSRVLHVSNLDAETCASVYPGIDTHQCKIVVVGQNFDSDSYLVSQLWYFPSGMKRQGLPDTDPNPMKWTSVYSSITVSLSGNNTASGLNDKGFAVNQLVDTDADYGKRDASIPGMSWSISVQYLLDNFATVDAAVASLKARPVQLVEGEGTIPNQSSINPLFHFALTDASGDSAIIEYVKPGILTIYHNNKDATYPVLTNQPNLPQQLAFLEYWKTVNKPSIITLDIGTLENISKITGAGASPGPSFLPGTQVPMDRFVRASLYQQFLPDAKTNESAVVNLLSVLRNVASPLTIWTGYPRTLWQSVANSTDLKFYYADTSELNIIFVDLKANIFQSGKVMTLDSSKYPALSGNVSDLFEPTVPFVFDGTE